MQVISRKNQKAKTKNSHQEGIFAEISPDKFIRNCKNPKWKGIYIFPFLLLIQIYIYGTYKISPGESQYSRSEVLHSPTHSYNDNNSHVCGCRQSKGIIYRTLRQSVRRFVFYECRTKRLSAMCESLDIPHKPWETIFLHTLKNMEAIIVSIGLSLAWTSISFYKEFFYAKNHKHRVNLFTSQ